MGDSKDEHSVATLTLEIWQPLVGAVFHVKTAEGDEADLELVQAADQAEQMHLPDAFRKPFSLLFEAPDEVTWPQGLFTFTHEAIGVQTLFCSAVVHPTDPGRRAYEVVFA